MLVVKTKLKEIEGKGIGLIADQEIKEGQLVWVFNPIIDIKVYKKNIPKEAKDFFNTYAEDYGGDYVYLDTDNARFVNHSDQPNIKNLGERGNCIAIRDIDIGEEITINYRNIGVDDIDFEVK